MSQELKSIYHLVKQGTISKEDALQRIKALQSEELNMNKAEGESNGPDFQSQLIDYLKSQVSSVLKLDVQKVRTNVSLDEYGLDSVMVVKITTQLEAHFGVLPKTLFFEYPSINELAGYFTGQYKEKVKSLFSAERNLKKNGLPVFELTTIEEKVDALSKKETTIEKLQPVLKRKNESQELAIIGLSGRYPEAGSVSEFWQNLKEGRNSISEVPKERWDHKLFYSHEKNKPGYSYCNMGGFIDGVDAFDPLFFKISPKEAKLMDPQERLFLECVYNTIEDAGYTHKKLSKGSGPANVGVFVGVMFEEYQLYAAQEWMLGINYSIPCNPSSIANRISYYFNFEGPSLAIDTMCSSSLTAIHQACKSIENGDCEMAIAGGVNVSIHPNKFMMLSQAGFLSEKGRCASFGDGGDGYVPGEGVGAVLIKEKSKAIADGDHIYAIIKGSAINHGGKTKSYTVPSPAAQARVIEKAYKRANVDPRTVSYIEAHGTGTALGDPIEISGLSRVLFKDTNRKKFCAIGSVKSNIGHCESAAGIAGLTKVLLQMKQRMLVPTIHSEVLNKNIDFENSPFRVQRNLQPWLNPELDLDGKGIKKYPRIAGVSSFGAGGSNAHIVLEEFSEENNSGISPENVRDEIILLSAKSEDRLVALAENLLTFLDRTYLNEMDLSRIAYTLQTGREHFEERLAVIVSDTEQLKISLKQYLYKEQVQARFRRGTVKNDEDTTKVLNAPELKSMYGSEELLDLWMKGIEIDWSMLYAGNYTPKKISLPGYAFNRHKYWMPQLDFSSTFNTNSSVAINLHPLLHQNTSTLKEQKFSSTFTGDELFLEDHKIHGNKIFPGVSYIEMIRKAVGLSVGIKENTYSIKNLKWIKPFIVQSNATIHLRLVPLSDNIIQVEFYEFKNGYEITLCSAEVHVSDKRSVEFPDLLTLQSSITRESFSTHELYERFKKAGLNYGSSHRGISKITIKGSDVLALIRLPEEARKNSADLYLHPSLMDSALQACAFNSKYSNASMTPLPYSVSEIQIFAPLTENVWAYIEVEPRSDKGTEEKNIYLFSPDGALLVYIKGFVVRNVEGTSELNSPVNGELLLTPVLENIKELSGNTLEYGAYTVLYSPLLNAEQVENYFEKTYKLVAFSSSCGSNPERFIDYSVQLLEEIKLLLRNNVPSFLHVIVEEGCAFEGMLGALKTAMQENPLFKGQLLVFDDALSLKDKLSKARASQETFLRFKNGEFYREVLKEVIPEVKPETTFIKDNGVYLITGGAGGLGQIFAKHISSGVNCKIILTGRSEENQRIKDLIYTLNKNKAEISYLTLDVTDLKEVQRVIDNVVARYGTINGVIHSAGIISDKYIPGKTIGDFKAVISPKILGASNLDEATRNIQMDWMVLFSSIAGAFGNVGQVDYALGNCYMDYFSYYRNQQVAKGKRTGKTVSINWPLWKEGGMNVSEELGKIIYDKTGMLPLPLTSGVNQFSQFLLLSCDRIVSLYGDADCIRKGLMLSLETRLNTVQKTKTESSVVADEVFTGYGLKYLQRLISSFLEMTTVVDPDTNFEAYGMDSVMIMQVTGKLEGLFGQLPKTLFFECVSLRSLNEYFVSNHTKRFREILELPEDTQERETTTQVTKDTFSVSSNGFNSFHEEKITSRFVTPQALKEPEKKNNYEKEDGAEDIAVIALAGKFPEADNIDEFWQNLKACKNCVTRVPVNRWKDEDSLGGFINNVDAFDPHFFHVSPIEAEVMDPQIRLFLENTWNLLENGAYSSERIKRTTNGSVGVFVGVMSNQYPFIQSSDKMINAVRTTAAFHAISNRTSYFFDFKGPSFTLDSACSSGLTAIHLACKSLLNEECKMAIAGGVNLSIHPDKFTGLKKLGFIGSDDNSRSFGDGDGYLPSEGVGAILLKKLSDAEKDKDQILAVIKSSHINHAGRSTGYSVPNPNQQAQLIEENFKRARISPETISYAELAVNGSMLGDAIELAGISSVFKKVTSKEHFCAIGSVKSNLGHGEAVSGISQIAKVVLQLYHKQLVPNVPVEKKNPNISFDGSPFYIQDKLQDWVVPTDKEKNRLPRRATVSSFGAGGSYSHIILEEYTKFQSGTNAVEKTGAFIVPLSARNWYDLREMSIALLHFIRNHTVEIDSFSKTLQLGRTEMKCRLAFVAHKMEEVAAALDHFIQQDNPQTSTHKGMTIFVNNSDVEKYEFKELLSDTEGDLYLKSLIEGKKYNKLALLWTCGSFRGWENIVEHSNASFITLPNYPFNYGKYWVRNEKEEEKEKEKESKPVLDFQNNHSPLKLITDFLEHELNFKPGSYSKDDHFEELGLSSFDGRKIAQIVFQELNVEIKTRDLLENCTLEKLVKFIEKQVKTSLVDVEGIDINTYDFGRIELTENQKGLWMLQKSEPGLTSYNIPVAIKLPQKTNHELVRKTCECLLLKHPVLKSVIVEEEGKPYMHIPETGSAHFEYINEDVLDVENYLRSLTQRVFKLEDGLVKFYLIRKNEDEYYFLLVIHHLIFDGASLPVLAQSFMSVYPEILKGEENIIGGRDTSFMELSKWEQKFLDSDKGIAMKEFWTTQLSGQLPILELPTDRPRPLVKGRKGKIATFLLDEELTRAVRTFSVKNRIKLTSLFLGMYKILVHRYTKEQDIIIGMPTMGRHEQKFADAIGYFVNMVSVRSTVDGDIQAIDLFNQLQLTIADAIDNSAYPFVSVVKSLNLPRNTISSPVFQIAFAFQNFMNGATMGSTKLAGGIELEGVLGVQQEGEYELLLEVYDHSTEFRLIFNYDENLYDGDSIERMYSHYCELLKAVLVNPDSKIADLSILSEREHALVVETWNDTVVPYNKAQLIHHGFEAKSKERPSAIALVCDGEELTYGELDARANQLSNYLIDKYGIKPGSTVGISVHRSFDMIVGVLAILKCGGIYVPLDYQNPPDRLKYICESSGVVLLLVHHDTSEYFEIKDLPKVCLDTDRISIKQYPADKPDVTVGSDCLAYIIYTSGSTGLPKGVRVSHYSVINLFEWIEKEFQIDHTDRVLFVASLSFDLSVYDIFGLLNAGGSIRIVNDRDLKDPEALTTILTTEPVTFWDSAPAALKQLEPFFARACAKGNATYLQTVFLSGDWIPLSLPKDIWKNFPNAKVISLGGATEATVWSNYYRVHEIDPYWLSIPYGRPIQNSFYYVLDDNLKPCPIGIPGNLYIGGDCLAQGYTDDAITKERFIPNPFNKDLSSKLYFTGDRARFRPDGNMEFLGRTDFQVKLRGYRIELGEIESVIGLHPDVVEAVAMVREDEPGNQLLVVYVLLNDGAALVVSELKKLTSEKLPVYMVPSAFIALDNFPVTVNGKLDRKALPKPGYENYETNRYEEPKTENEILLANIWKNVLKLEKVGVKDNLFEIGGDSLIAMQIIFKASQVGLNFSARTIFENPTIFELALAASDKTDIVADQDMVLGDVPLTPVQSWFFEEGFASAATWDQKVLVYVEKDLDLNILKSAFVELIKHHDMLRASFVLHNDGSVKQQLTNKFDFTLEYVSVEAGITSAQLEAIVSSGNGDFESNSMLKVVHAEIANEHYNQMLISIHHLVVDAISWQILLEDLKNIYHSLLSGDTLKLPFKTTSFQYWSERLQQKSCVADVEKEINNWTSLLKEEYLPLVNVFDKSRNLEGNVKTQTLQLDVKVTNELFDKVIPLYEAKADDVLLAGLSGALATWQKVREGKWLVSVEGHGREELFEEVDLTRTVGWFTTIFPVAVSFNSDEEIASTISRIKKERELRTNNGINYGILKYVYASDDLINFSSKHRIDISFNYFGRFAGENTINNFEIVPGSFGVLRSAEAHRPYALEMDLVRLDTGLFISLKYSDAIIHEDEVKELLSAFGKSLSSLVSSHTSSYLLNYADPAFLTGNKNGKENVTYTLESINDADGVELPLSGLQLAYKIGEKPYFTLDNIVAHEYFEIEYKDLDVERYANAWQKLIAHNDILKAVTTGHNTLKLLTEVPAFFPEIVDYKNLSIDERERKINFYRKKLKEEGPDTSQWPLFKITVHLYEPEKIIVHVNIAIILIDGMSLRMMFENLMRLYNDPAFELEEQNLSVKEYYALVEEYKRSKNYLLSKLYWKKRIPTLPDPPELPVNVKLEEVGKSDLLISNYLLPESYWVRLKQIAAKFRITPSSVLLSTFAKVLSLWSSNRDFTFSILHANRYNVHDSVNSLLGNFSTTTIFEADFNSGETFVELVSRLQERLQKDLEHFHYSGVEVIADRNVHLKKLHGGIPIALSDTTVFEEKYGQEQSGKNEKVNFSGAQTPFVYLDCILHKLDGGVNLRWAYQSGIFPENMIADMQETNVTLLKMLASSEEVWEKALTIPLPVQHIELRNQVNETQGPVSNELLHSLFIEKAKQTPFQVALKSSRINMTYQELFYFSNQVAGALRENGVVPNQLVAVVMNKGWEQVPAVLATLISGGAYMPVDASFPKDRIENLLQIGEVKVVLTQEDVRIDWPEGITAITISKGNFQDKAVDELNVVQKKEDLAYVIFTSGSTGIPKGVMIDHIGAVNTITDINERYNINSRDSLLAISALNFDLSVYDIFGVLAAGGTVVMPDPGDHLEPQKLLAWVKNEKITLWNSVPAFVQMFVEHISEEDAKDLGSLRLFMMSGDWIPVELPGKLKALLKGAEVHSLGGATEASIWSIAYEIEKVDPKWKSIPYGKPMKNQTFEILDEELQPLPVWAPGELYIGGIGVAKGYWKDPVKTEESFICHPSDGRRLYKTGDLGRYMSDGNIEFLGRADNQVKVQGYRIELGEIETILRQHSLVKDCLVAVKEIVAGEKQLVAYVISGKMNKGKILELNTGEFDLIKEFLKTVLPHYQIPHYFLNIDHIPVTANGKINKNNLPLPVLTFSKTTFIAPGNKAEIEIAELLKEVLGINKFSINDRFFDLGGHSISAVRLISNINKKYGKKFPVSVLNEYDTVEALAGLISNEREVKFSALVELNTNGSLSPFYCIHPIGGHVMSYQELAKCFFDRPFIGIQSPGIVDAEDVFETVEEMAGYYVSLIKKRQPEGPYFIGGWSFGGIVAFEIARLLERSGDTISGLVMIDSYLPQRSGSVLDDDELFPNFIVDLNGRFQALNLSYTEFSLLTLHEKQKLLLKCMKERGIIPEETDLKQLEVLYQVYKTNMIAMNNYQVSKINTPVHLIKAKDRKLDSFSMHPFASRIALGWEEYAKVRVIEIEGDHYSIFDKQDVGQLASLISGTISDLSLINC